MATNPEDEFIAEGMKRYGSAYKTVIAFEDMFYEKLVEILQGRKEWGNFTPDFSTLKPGRTGRNYAFIYAVLAGKNKLNNEDRVLEISFNGESDPHCYYTLWRGKEYNKFTPKDLSGKIYVGPDKWATVLRIDLNLEDIDLERDYNLLLDELLKYGD